MAFEAFALPGYRLEMYPEDHSPPHFHIIKDHWNIRIKFNLCRIKNKIVWDSKYPADLPESPLSSSEEAKLLKLINQHSKALNKQWKELHPSKKGLKKKQQKKKTEEGKENGSSRKKQAGRN